MHKGIAGYSYKPSSWTEFILSIADEGWGEGEAYLALNHVSASLDVRG